jgi:hypothetical protein
MPARGRDARSASLEILSQVIEQTLLFAQMSKPFGQLTFIFTQLRQLTIALFHAHAKLANLSVAVAIYDCLLLIRAVKPQVRAMQIHARAVKGFVALPAPLAQQ